MKFMFGRDTIEVTPKELACMLARTNSEDQATFFNEFNKQLQAACDGSILGMGYQLIAISKGLDVETEAVFALLHREIENKLYA